MRIPNFRPSPYRNGFVLGVNDYLTNDHKAAEVAAGREASEQTGEPEITPEQESDYWLGYYQGRAYARSGGALPPGASGRFAAEKEAN